MLWVLKRTTLGTIRVLKDVQSLSVIALVAKVNKPNKSL